MPYDVRQSVMDALNACREIQEYTMGHTLETYHQSSQRVAAVERKFEILGEAFKRIDAADPSFRNRFPEAGEIIGMRNRLIHGYDVVSDAVVWTAVEKRIPHLMDKLAEWLEEHSNGDAP